jgi:hypothetical protein
MNSTVPVMRLLTGFTDRLGREITDDNLDDALTCYAIQLKSIEIILFNKIK